MAHVLDSSALLALILAEPGGDVVEPLLGEAVISAVNLCEVASKLIDRGYGPDETAEGLKRSEIDVEPVTEGDALAAARLRPVTRSVGLSLGDRLCLALAGRLQCPAFTADRRWGELAVGIEVQLIR